MPDDSDRIFQGDSTYPEHEEWYYRAREGIVGPYLKREDAAIALEYFVRYCQRHGITGGRGPARRPPADGRGLLATLLWAARHLPRALLARMLRR
jgi:hypothetical protein